MNEIDFIHEDYWGDESLTEHDPETDTYWVKPGWFEDQVEADINLKISGKVIAYADLPQVPTGLEVK